jgi:ADP-ribosylation factor-binding protein GGA
MLRTQGVIHLPQRNVIAPSKKSTDNTLKLMESDKFKRLLQSKNQKDIEAANLMIQNMVREETRRTEIKNRRLIDLQSANENSILLKEMLDELDPSNASDDTLSTLQDIYNNCVKLKPTVCRLAEESHESETFMNKILETSELLNTTIELYTAIVINKTPVAKKSSSSTAIVNAPTKSTNLLDVYLNEDCSSSNVAFSELNEIFSASAPNTQPITSQFDDMLLTPAPTQTSVSGSNISDILTLINSRKQPSQSKGDLLGNFSSNESAPSTQNSKATPLSELDSIVSGMKTKLLTSPEEEKAVEIEDDDKMITNSEIPQISVVNEVLSPINNANNESLVNSHSEKKVALKDINLDINDIQPSDIEMPRTILEEKKGLKVIVNFTKDHPGKDVSVLVISGKSILITMFMV